MHNSLINTLSDHKVRHVSYLKTVADWIRNRQIKYNTVNFDYIRSRVKKSDTIFILGTGATINDIPEKHWHSIGNHDSAGINLWPLHNFVPTYYYSEYHHNREHFRKTQNMMKQKISSEYTDTIFFLSLNRAVKRGIHPRVTKNMFPQNPKICFYNYIRPLRFDDPSELSTESFERTIFYRGALTALLDLVDQIGYKKIVLLGIDLKNGEYFYDNNPEFRKINESGLGRAKEKRIKTPHLTTRGGARKIPIQEYLYILNDKYYKPKKIELFCGSEKSLLAEKIPIYNFTD